MVGKILMMIKPGKVARLQAELAETKDRLRGVESGMIASHEMLLSLGRMQYARSLEEKKAYHGASRQLRGRGDQKNKRAKKFNRFQLFVLKALGIYWVIEDQGKDMEAIADHFRFSGDVQNKLSDSWVGLNFEQAASHIDARMPKTLELLGPEAAEDNAQAAQFVRAMRQLIDPKATIKDNDGQNQQSESATS